MEQAWHTRAICYYTIAPYLSDKNMRMEKFWPLPSDGDTRNLEPTKEQMIARMKEFETFYEKQRQEQLSAQNSN